MLHVPELVHDGLYWRSAVTANDVARVWSLVASTGFFNAAEVEVATGLIADRLTKGLRSGYHFILAERGETLVGYACYGLLGAAFLAFGNLLPAGPARAARRKGKGGRSAAATPTAEGKNLKPGQFTWHPERSPSGPVAIIVSVPKQHAYVYRNGILIGVSTCSTGKKGFETPTGVFTILKKAKEHASSEFDDAPMPHMERLTWGGVALHAGKLPGYPASHGPNSPKPI